MTDEPIVLLMIAPPIGPYSPPEEIRAWIAELENMEDREEVRSALDTARRWLERSVQAWIQPS